MQDVLQYINEATVKKCRRLTPRAIELIRTHQEPQRYSLFGAKSIAMSNYREKLRFFTNAT